MHNASVGLIQCFPIKIKFQSSINGSWTNRYGCNWTSTRETKFFGNR